MGVQHVGYASCQAAYVTQNSGRERSRNKFRTATKTGKRPRLSAVRQKLNLLSHIRLNDDTGFEPIPN
jgi:hypothetical protein